MATRTLGVVAAAVVAVGMLACEPAERADAPGKTGAAPAAEPAATAPAAPAAAKEGRAISPAARSAMKDILAGAGAGHRAWILSQPGDGEVATLVGNLSAVFKEAGWT